MHLPDAKTMKHVSTISCFPTVQHRFWLRNIQHKWPATHCKLLRESKQPFLASLHCRLVMCRARQKRTKATRSSFCSSPFSPAKRNWAKMGEKWEDEGGNDVAFPSDGMVLRQGHIGRERSSVDDAFDHPIPQFHSPGQQQ